MTDNLFSDPMFWAFMIVINVIFLLKNWKHEQNITLMRVALIAALIGNSIVLWISLNYGVVLNS